MQYYCNAKCQKAAWSSHKKQCQWTANRRAEQQQQYQEMIPQHLHAFQEAYKDWRMRVQEYLPHLLYAKVREAHDDTFYSIEEILPVNGLPPFYLKCHVESDRETFGFHVTQVDLCEFDSLVRLAMKGVANPEASPELGVLAQYEQLERAFHEFNPTIGLTIAAFSHQDEGQVVLLATTPIHHIQTSKLAITTQYNSNTLGVTLARINGTRAKAAKRKVNRFNEFGTHLLKHKVTFGEFINRASRMGTSSPMNHTHCLIIYVELSSQGAVCKLTHYEFVTIAKANEVVNGTMDTGGVIFLSPRSHTQFQFVMQFIKVSNLPRLSPKNSMERAKELFNQHADSWIN